MTPEEKTIAHYKAIFDFYKQKFDEMIEHYEREIKNLKSWEPKGGEFAILSDGSVIHSKSGNGQRLFGSERESRKLAERASKEMRFHNLLLAYRDEHCQEYEPDWSEDSRKWAVQYDHRNNRWELFYNNHLQPAGCVYFPKDVAEELCRKLNNNEFLQ